MTHRGDKIRLGITTGAIELGLFIELIEWRFMTSWSETIPACAACLRPRVSHSKSDVTRDSPIASGDRLAEPWRRSREAHRNAGKSTSQDPFVGAASHFGPELQSRNSLPPANATDGHQALNSYRGRSKDGSCFLPRFHGAPGVEAAPRGAGQNSCADNELAGAPGRIRTSDPQIRSLLIG